MAENSKIEWTDHTWNPWYGCTQVGPPPHRWMADGTMVYRSFSDYCD